MLAINDPGEVDSTSRYPSVAKVLLLSLVPESASVQTAQNYFQELIGSVLSLVENPAKDHIQAARILLLFEDEITVENLARFSFEQLIKICRLTPENSPSRKKMLKAMVSQQLSFEQLKEICPYVPPDATFGEESIRLEGNQISMEQWRELRSLPRSKPLLDRISARIVTQLTVSSASPEEAGEKHFPETILGQMFTHTSDLTYADYSFILGETSIQTAYGQRAARGMIETSAGFRQAAVAYGLVQRDSVLKDEALEKMFKEAKDFHHFLDLFRRLEYGHVLLQPVVQKMLELSEAVRFEDWHRVYKKLSKMLPLPQSQDRTSSALESNDHSVTLGQLLESVLQKLVQTATTFEQAVVILLNISLDHPERSRIEQKIFSLAQTRQDWRYLYHHTAGTSQRAIVERLDEVLSEDNDPLWYYYNFPDEADLKQKAEAMILAGVDTIEEQIDLYNRYPSGSSVRQRLFDRILHPGNQLDSKSLACMYARSAPNSRLQRHISQVILEIAAQRSFVWIVAMLEKLQQQPGLNRSHDRGLAATLYKMLEGNHQQGNHQPASVIQPPFETKLVTYLKKDSRMTLADFSFGELGRFKKIVAKIDRRCYIEILSAMLSQADTYERTIDLFDDIQKIDDKELLERCIQKLAAQASTYSRASLVYRSLPRGKAALKVDDLLLKKMVDCATTHVEIYALCQLTKNLTDSRYFCDAVAKMVPFLSHLTFEQAVELYRVYQPLVQSLDKTLHAIKQSMATKAQHLEQYHLLKVLGDDDQDQSLSLQGQTGMDRCSKRPEDWLQLYRRSASRPHEQRLLQKHLLENINNFSLSMWLYDAVIEDELDLGALEASAESLLCQYARSLDLGELLHLSRQRADQQRGCEILHRVIMEKIVRQYPLPHNLSQLVILYKQTRGDPKLNFQLAEHILGTLHASEHLLKVFAEAPLNSFLFEKVCEVLKPHLLPLLNRPAS